jgi:hypothetical protein
MGRGKTGCEDDSYAEVTWLREAQGTLPGTMLPTRSINYGRGRTVAPGTFVVDRAEAPPVRVR